MTGFNGACHCNRMILGTWQRYGRTEGVCTKGVLWLFRNETPNLAGSIRHKWTFPLSHCTRITSLHSLIHKRIFKQQLTGKQILNILLSGSQHSFVFMSTIEWYSLHKAKQSKTIIINPRKPLLTHILALLPFYAVCTTPHGQISHWHCVGSPKSRMSQHFKG